MHIDSINSQVHDSVCFPLIEKGAVIFRFILMLVWINSTLEDLLLDLDMGGGGLFFIWVLLVNI